MGIYRSRLLEAYEQLVDSIAQNKRKNLAGQFDLFGGGDQMQSAPELQVKNIPEFTRHELMTMERRRLDSLHRPPHGRIPGRGQAVQGGLYGGYLSDFAQEGGPAIYHDEQRVTLAGVITAPRTKTTRNNSLMAYVTLEDDTASMEMLVFARVLGEAGPYLKEGVAVLAEGRISVRDGRRPSSCATGYAPWIR